MKNIKIIIDGKEIKAQIDEKELEIKKKGFWKPETGEYYFFINDNSNFESVRWRDRAIDQNRFNLGNCFKDLDEADKHTKYLKIKQELREWASKCENKVDWENPNQNKYGVFYDGLSDEIKVTRSVWSRDDNIYFADEEILKQAIEAIGEERLKKEYCGDLE